MVKVYTSMKSLDLGCGSGMDVYILSQLVGSEGKVIGIDMTQEQLDKAEAHPYGSRPFKRFT